MNRKETETTMKKNRFLWAALSMTAALVMTACSGDDDTTESPAQQGGAKTIPYTVTVNGGGETRATVESDNKTLYFATGDKLYVTGTDIKGVLDIESGTGTASATFSGDLTYTGEGAPASELALTATLVSEQQTAGTEITVDATTGAVTVNYPTTAYCADVATAVQKYSQQTGTSTYGAKSFALSQQTAFLNFAITFEDGTTSGTALSATVSNGGAAVCTANVTTTTVSEKVVAQFVLPVAKGTTLSSASVKMGWHDAITFGASQTLEGKVYNIKKTVEAWTAPDGALSGQFTVADGTKVCFSQGNLQATYDGSSWTWNFATNQWDYIGNDAGNTCINGDGTVSAPNVTVDLFGWVGASSTWTGAAQYGISNSQTANDYGTDATESLKSDWGRLMGTGWRTLTKDEWVYVFNTRTTGGTVFGTSQARYAKATINTSETTSVNGVILFPDGVDIASSEVTTPGTVNNGTSDYATKCTADQWSALADKGCVFLPAAGYREGVTVYFRGSSGYYWSSSPNTSNVNFFTHSVYFYSGNLSPQYNGGRYYGHAVRLVCQVK